MIMKVSDDFNYIHKELDFHKLPYKEEIERSTSIDRTWTWRQSVVPTILPEISARRSLLEPSFRYLSPGSEGEKFRPLDHLRQIPFVHLDRFVTILPCGTHKCVYITIVHVLLQKPLN